MVPLRDRLTVLHYTSSRQSARFEAAVRAQWLAHVALLELPLVVVAQQRIPDLPDDSTQLVVGDVGASGFNMFRQIWLGLAFVSTPYVLSVEADCLYPLDYFTAIPDGCATALARNGQTYLIGNKRRYYWHKPEGGTWAQVTATAHYRTVLDQVFAGQPDWSPAMRNFPKEITGQNDLPGPIVRYQTQAPCISLKAKGGMRHASHAVRVPIDTLPYWGPAATIVEELQPWVW